MEEIKKNIISKAPEDLIISISSSDLNLVLRSLAFFINVELDPCIEDENEFTESAIINRERLIKINSTIAEILKVDEKELEVYY